MNLGTCKLFARLKVPIDCYLKRISIAFQGLSESFDVLCRDCCIRENLRRCRSMCESHKASQDCKVGQGSQPPLPVGESQGCAQCQRRNYLASPKTFEEHPTPRQSQQNHQTTLVPWLVWSVWELPPAMQSSSCACGSALARNSSVMRNEWPEPAAISTTKSRMQKMYWLELNHWTASLTL